MSADHDIVKFSASVLNSVQMYAIMAQLWLKIWISIGFMAAAAIFDFVRYQFCW